MYAKANRRRVNWRRLSIVVAVVAVSFLTGYAAMAYFITGKSPLPAAINPFTPESSTPKRINLLLLGIDARKGEKDARTDSIIFASIDPAQKKAALISIPRDSLVDIPGHGEDKINAANVIGGPELTKEIVENLLDVKIDNYVKTNFSGFRDIIDTLGGVTIDVEKNMHYDDPTDGTHINLHEGVQHLTGKTALDYARFRHDALGDISRTQRQQKLLKAVAAEMLQGSTVLKLPALIPQINSAVETDLSLTDMLKLAAAAKDMKDMQVVSQTLPGQFYNNHGSYWKVDEGQAKLILAKMLSGEETQVVSGPDINVQTKSTRSARAEVKKPAAPVVKEPVKTPEAADQTTSGDRSQALPGEDIGTPSESGTAAPGGIGTGQDSTGSGSETSLPATDNGTAQSGAGGNSGNQGTAAGEGTGQDGVRTESDQTGTQTSPSTTGQTGTLTGPETGLKTGTQTGTQSGAALPESAQSLSVGHGSGQGQM